MRRLLSAEQTRLECTTTTSTTLDVSPSGILCPQACGGLQLPMPDAYWSARLPLPTDECVLRSDVVAADNRRLDEWVTVDRLNLATVEPEDEIGEDGK